MREIKLTQGKVTVVDDEDYEFLLQYNWCAQRKPKTFYAKRQLPRVNGKRRTEHMHRIVLARKLGREIDSDMISDHEDGDGLNNQRNNLREVTKRGNQENRHVAKTSQYLGVCWHKTSGKWHAQIQVGGKIISLGYHETELEAALAREKYIDAHPELGATTNFPNVDKATQIS